LIALLFQHRSFDAHSTDLVAWALLWYAAGLVGHNFVEILSRAFYALHDTKTPVFVGAGAMTLNVVFSFAFSDLFARIGWQPHGGLALANSLATAMEMTLLFILMRRRLKGLEGKDILRGFIQAASGTAVMSLILLYWSNIQSSVWIIGLGGVALGGIVYGVSLWMMKVKELASLAQGIARRIKPAH
jgi:putative peptidoglycan lipid II flippase